MSLGPGRTENAALIARDFRSGDWVRVALDGATIADVQPAVGSDRVDDLDPWIAPALWDIQTNGRWGVSFSDGALSVEQAARIVRAQAGTGVARLCPTLITASAEALLHGVATIASACESDAEINRRVLGIHLEGPWIADEDGYRGAHPREHVRDPDWPEFEALQRASGSRIVLVTLAPERSGAIEFIERLTDSGVAVGLGHSSADAATVEAACRAGARMWTHLGNGVPAVLPRHPNPIWNALARPELSASFIADGRHLDPVTLGVLVRAKGAAKAVFVSDASPLADAPPGMYGPWEVRADGSIVVAGTPYLAGSNLDLWRAIPFAMEAAGMSLTEAIDAATANPAGVLRLAAPAVAPGMPADLIVFRCPAGDSPEFELCATLVGGEWAWPMAEDVAL